MIHMTKEDGAKSAEEFKLLMEKVDRWQNESLLRNAKDFWNDDMDEIIDDSPEVFDEEIMTWK
jgi:hypothetical protein